MKLQTSITAAVLALSLLAISGGAQARNLYRYYNAEGNIVVDYQVPPEFVSKGYEVLNEEGAVVRVVPRELTPEERSELDAQQLQQDSAEAEEKRLREWDESLMLRYSSVEDIEAARDRALQDLRIRMSILKGNKRSLKQQVENYQAQAADLERSGREVDLARLKTIEDLQNEIVLTNRAIGERGREIDELAAAYQQDIERFELLLDVVQLRRNMTTQAKTR